jgi:hypothetical protein
MTASPPEQITRAYDGGRIYPLGESGRPKVAAAPPATRVKQLIAAVDWLDCEDPAHARYQPKAGASYACTYVADYAGLAGIYLPQVWWTADAMARIALEQGVDVVFNQTVRELCTNALFDWFDEYGTAFGWHREVELSNLQDAANAGEVALIIAKNQELSRPGQAAAVLPEQDGMPAKRDQDGDCLRPLQSLCGPKNVRCAVADTAWWVTSKYQSHAFWRHPG